LANAADRALLAEPLSSADVAARGFTAPYSTFPTSESLASALMPFPQFGSGLRYSLVGDAVGNYWYNALQITATQRLSRGLWVLANYTWAKDIGTVNDNSGDAVSVGNQDVPLKTMKTLPTTDIPHTLNISYQYELPTFGLARNWATRTLLKGWTTTGILHYASGVVMQIPGSNAGLTSITFASNNFMNRVPGQKLFLHSLNKHNVNPYTTLFLNPNAWQEPAPGTYNSGKPFLDDYRGPRYPNEQMGLAKNTKLSEKVTFNVRADFFNIFNRWAYPGLNNTSNTGAQTQYGNDGAITNGFGYIGDSMTGEAGNYPARTGQIVARIQF